MSADLAALADVVAPAILVDAIETSRRLTELAVPHALIGGLAVGLHGHPRVTKDVDFLVGDEAFERTTPFLVFRAELADIVRLGVVDLMGVPARHKDLHALLTVPEEGAIPVIPVPALVLLKLLAGRPQDVADVGAMVDAGADLAAIRDYLAVHEPDLVPALARIVG